MAASHSNASGIIRKQTNLAGQRFGRLLVVEKSTEKPRKGQFWKCLCDCGTKCLAVTSHLTTGFKRSCGCLKRESSRRTALKHGIGDKSRKHGMYRTSEYRIWSMMRQRCSNPKTARYARYGGRGISVCDRWMSFENFYADMGPRPSPKHSVERKDNNAGYSPENCVWTTHRSQSRNKSTNRLIEYHGETKTLMEWSEVLRIHYYTIHNRIKLGWSIEEAFTQPVSMRRT